MDREACLSVSSSGLGADGGVLAAVAICIWQFLAVFSRTSARIMARLLSLASSSAILILSYGKKFQSFLEHVIRHFYKVDNISNQLMLVKFAVAKESQRLESLLTICVSC